MRAGYEIFYLGQWVVFLIRWVLSAFYGALQFVAKPGSRYIVPTVIAVVGYFNLAAIEGALIDFINNYNTAGTPELLASAQRSFREAYYGQAVEPWMVHVGLVILFLIACYLYVLLSRALAVVIGAFPKITRPLRPLRRLRATEQKIKSAVVQIAVPKLRF